jgi:hypothetical protein
MATTAELNLTFFNFIPPFSIFSLAAILVGSRDHRTKFWKGAIQESFHKSLGPPS